MSSGDQFDPTGQFGETDVDIDDITRRVDGACAANVSALGVAWAELSEQIESAIEGPVATVESCHAVVTDNIKRQIEQSRKWLSQCPVELRTQLIGRITEAQQFYLRCLCDWGDDPTICALADLSKPLPAELVAQLDAPDEPLGNVSPETFLGISSLPDDMPDNVRDPSRLPASEDGIPRLPDQQPSGRSPFANVPEFVPRLSDDEAECLRGAVPSDPVIDPAGQLRDQLVRARIKPTVSPDGVCRAYWPDQFGRWRLIGVDPAYCNLDCETVGSTPPAVPPVPQEPPIVPEPFEPEPTVTPPTPTGTSCTPCIRLCPEETSPVPLPEDTTPSGEPPEITSTTSTLPSAGYAGGDCSVDAYLSLLNVSSSSRGLNRIVQQVADFLSGSRHTNVTLTGLLGMNAGDVWDFIGSRIKTSIWEGAWNLAQVSTSLAPCVDPGYLTSHTFLAVGGLMSKWLSADVDQMLWPIRYSAQRICPTEFPKVDEALATWLGGAISDDTLATWATQNNRCWPPFERVAHAARSKPDAGSATVLFRRDEISESEWRRLMRNEGWTSAEEQDAFKTAREVWPDIGAAVKLWFQGDVSESQFRLLAKRSGVSREDLQILFQRIGRTIPPLETLLQLKRRDLLEPDQLDASLKALGILGESERTILAKLEEQFPPIPDLVRFMVRDVEDPNIVDTFGLDTDFFDKYQGATKRWVEGQGYTEDYMRRVWRAHWSIPSAGQLLQFFHRFSRLPENDPRHTSIDDVTTALQQQDILPFWIPRFVGASFRILTRVDVRRAFNIGAINRDEVKEVYQQSGYSPADAERLTAFAERLRDRGLPREWETKAYARDIMSRNDAANGLIRKGFPRPSVERALDRVDLERDADHRDICKRALRRRFILQDIDAIKYRNELIVLGMPAEAADRNVESAKCELAARGRELTGSQLCKMMRQNIIGPMDAHKRLVKLGFSRDEAAAQVVSCQLDIADAERKRLEKELREQEAAERRRQKALEKAQKELERQQKQAERAREAAERKQNQREKLLMQIASRLSAVRDMPIDEAWPLVNTERRRLQRDYVFNPDELLQVLDQAARQAKEEPSLAYPELVTFFADERTVLEGEFTNTGNGQSASGEPTSFDDGGATK